MPGETLASFPGIMKKPSLILEETTTMVHAGMILAFRRVDFLPVIRGGLVIGRFGGFEIVRTLLELGGPGIFEKKVGEVYGSQLGLVGPTDTVDELLDVMEGTKFGHACVVRGKELVATVALRNLVRYAPRLGVAPGVSAGDLATPTICLSARDTFRNLLNTMIKNRIRRVVIRDRGPLAVADDRVVVEQTFSREGLRALKANPSEIFNRAIFTLPLQTPENIRGSESHAEACSRTYQSLTECLLVDGGEKILTPWDLTVKPHIRGQNPPRM